MPSALMFQRQKGTIPICRQRLNNSVAGSAEICMNISKSLSCSSKNAACIRAELELLSSTFDDMRNAFEEVNSLMDISTWHDNATTTIKHAQKVCQQVADQVRDIIRGIHDWTVVAPDHIIDNLDALAISLQEQEITLSLLMWVLQFVTFWAPRPKALQGYTPFGQGFQYFEDDFLNGVRNNVLTRRRMKQDILQLRSEGQRLEPKVITTSSVDHPDTDMWSSTQYTTATGIMTPTSDDHQPATRRDGDGALEDLLEAPNGEFTQKDLARLVFHWTNVETFGEFEKHDLTSPL